MVLWASLFSGPNSASGKRGLSIGVLGLQTGVHDQQGGMNGPRADVSDFLRWDFIRFTLSSGRLGLTRWLYTIFRLVKSVYIPDLWT